MQSENNIAREILVALSKLKTRLFRNNTGMAWTGEAVIHRGDHVIIHNPRPVQFGLTKGSSDYIGWTTITVTPCMVGLPIAVFTAIEVKKNKRARKTQEQHNFIAAILAAGGKAGFATSIEEAKRIVE